METEPTRICDHFTGHRLKFGPGFELWTYEKMYSLKDRPVGKTGPQELKTLPFVSNHTKDNVVVILFHIKGIEASFSCK